MSKVTLEQWRMLHAVIEHGGFAQASQALFKSQSTISYAVNKLQGQLGVQILEIRGRKAELTEAGKVMLRRSQALLRESDSLEKVAGNLASGWKGVITLGVEALFPNSVLFEVLEEFATVSSSTRIELIESVLSGTTDLVESDKADLVITGLLPKGHLGEKLLSVEMIPVARFDHPLFQLGRMVTENDIKQHRQIVLRDSGARRDGKSGWLKAEERWTVSSLATMAHLAEQGLGFAWLPEHCVKEQLQSGIMKSLFSDSFGSKYVPLYMLFPDADNAGPAAHELACIFRKYCLLSK